MCAILPRLTLHRLVAVAALAFTMGHAGAQEMNVVRLTSAEWPPFVSDGLKQQGALSAVVKAAFSAVGYRVEIEFYPWVRAIKLANDPKKPFHGYFPDYHNPANPQEVIYSLPIGKSPVGFAEQTAKPIKWTSLDDLAKFRIGVVNGYLNTPEFDERVAKGQLQTDVAPSDVNNLLKLDAGRVDLAVVDPLVLAFVVNNSPAFSGKRATLQMNRHLLDDMQLFVCFRKGEEGQHLEREFARGLKKINAEAIIANYIKGLREANR